MDGLGFDWLKVNGEFEQVFCYSEEYIQILLNEYLEGLVTAFDIPKEIIDWEKFNRNLKKWGEKR